LEGKVAANQYLSGTKAEKANVDLMLSEEPWRKRIRITGGILNYVRFKR
jgi:hypothetical protein